MDIQRFLDTFLRSSSANRAQLLIGVARANPDPQIGNLLQNVDVNYKPQRDQKLEAAERRKPSNIYFVCQMLQAFPNFKFVY